MADYFLLLDAGLFARLRGDLAECWRRRSFGPCRGLCAEVLPRVEAFDARYHLGEGVPLPAQVVRGLTFHRDFWRALVGELLLYAAAEVPEFQTCPDTLCCLLAPEQYGAAPLPRRDLAPIRQAHLGARDLTFGAVAYRPDHCGLNDADDVGRLAAYLAGIDPSAWRPADLAPLPECANDEERREELEVAREWLLPLWEMYRRARREKQVIVCEFL